MKCRDCKYCYSNETMRDLYICVNGNAENFGQFTGLLCEDDCPDGEEYFIYPEAYDVPFDEIDREDTSTRFGEGERGDKTKWLKMIL